MLRVIAYTNIFINNRPYIDIFNIVIGPAGTIVIFFKSSTARVNSSR